jgi:hypothetical protein
MLLPQPYDVLSNRNEHESTNNGTTKNTDPVFQGKNNGIVVHIATVRNDPDPGYPEKHDKANRPHNHGLAIEDFNVSTVNVKRQYQHGDITTAAS